MSLLITLVIILVILGLAKYIIDMLGFDPKLTKLITIVIAVIALLYLLGALGGYVPEIKYP